ncbi:MAG TPA: hypothetical protein VNI79_07520 [Sphingomicrobium sp.]|nr:hypothetical protein [Sphingomicrobium sp.]
MKARRKHLDGSNDCQPIRSFMLYYLASTLAMTAVMIIIIDGGFTSDEHFRIGFLSFMAIIMVWQGSRQKPKPAD